MKIVTKIEFNDEEKEFLEGLENICVKYEDCADCPLYSFCRGVKDEFLAEGVDRLLDGQ